MLKPQDLLKTRPSHAVSVTAIGSPQGDPSGWFLLFLRDANVIQGVWVVSHCFTYWRNSSNSLVNCGLCLKNRRFQILHRFATESANVFQTTSEQHGNQYLNYLNSNLGLKHVGLQPMQVVHFRCTIDYPGIASRCQLFTSSHPYLWRASYTIRMLAKEHSPPLSWRDFSPWIIRISQETIGTM